jgi:hypothetical protein
MQGKNKVHVDKVAKTRKRMLIADHTATANYQEGHLAVLVVFESPAACDLAVAMIMQMLCDAGCVVLLQTHPMKLQLMTACCLLSHFDDETDTACRQEMA